MIKVTIENEGEPARIIEGDWICGTVYQNKGDSCAGKSLLIGNVLETFLPQLMARNAVSILMSHYPREERDKACYHFKRAVEMVMNGEMC